MFLQIDPLRLTALPSTPGESRSGTLVGIRFAKRGTPRMSQLYVVVLAVLVVVLLSVAIDRTSQVNTKGGCLMSALQKTQETL
jgi:hypothetical protein